MNVCTWLVPGREYLVLAWRILSLIILSSEVALGYVYSDSPINDWYLLSKWSVYCTWLTTMLGIFSMTEPPKDFMNRKYKNSCCQAWKWHTIFYQTTFTVISVIAIYFWPVLYYHSNLEGDNAINGYKVKIVDNYLPLFLMLVDYVISNPVFTVRHIWFTNIFSILYTIANLIGSLINDLPPYEFMNWKSAVGVIVPILLSLSFPLFHYIIFLITR
jgi:magnesium-transporting ATPase (P-type)